MTYTMGAGTAFNMVLSHPDTSDPSTWKPERAIQDMRNEFQNWDPVYGLTLDLTTSLLFLGH